MSCLNDLRSKENSQNNRASIVSLIMGMKFFRVKVSFFLPVIISINLDKIANYKAKLNSAE